MTFPILSRIIGYGLAIILWYLLGFPGLLAAAGYIIGWHVRFRAIMGYWEPDPGRLSQLRQP